MRSHRRFYGAIPLGQDEMRRQGYGFFTSHWVSLFFPLHFKKKKGDSARWLCEDIKMAIGDMLMLVAQLSFWKHQTAVAQSFDDTSIQPKCFSGLMLQRREWDQTGSSVWRGAFWRSWGLWTNDPAKCISGPCYHPALFPMIHDEFCRFVGCKSEKEIKLHLTLCSFFPPFFKLFLCYICSTWCLKCFIVYNIYSSHIKMKPSLVLHLAPKVSVNLCRSQHRGFLEGHTLADFIDLFKSTSA